MELLARRATVRLGLAVVVFMPLIGCSLPKRQFVPERDPSRMSDDIFLHYLASVPVVTVDEGMRAFLLLRGPSSKWPGHNLRKGELLRIDAVELRWKLPPYQVLDKGTAAHMLRTICDLPTGVNEHIARVTHIGQRRYALRACVDAGLMPYGRATDPMTGGDLLAALTKADEYLADDRP